MKLRFGYVVFALLFLACSGGDDGGGDGGGDGGENSDGGVDLVDAGDTSETVEVTKDTGEPWPWPTCPEKAAAGPSLAEK